MNIYIVDKKGNTVDKITTNNTDEATKQLEDNMLNVEVRDGGFIYSVSLEGFYELLLDEKSIDKAIDSLINSFK